MAFELVKKTEWVFNEKRGNWQRKSPLTKNELYRRMLFACAKNRIKFRHVLSDVWYASSGNMRYIEQELKKDSIMPLKSDRKVALPSEDKKRGNYERVASLELEPATVRKVYPEQVEFPLLLVKQDFKNEDDSEGALYLVSSDVTPNYERLTTIYQGRWKVEGYHKSLKSSASLAESPTKTIRTQGSQSFARIHAFVKLERMKNATRMNHFAPRSRLHPKAIQAAYQELQELTSVKQPTLCAA